MAPVRQTILKARQRAKSVSVPNAHSSVGTANTLEYVVSGTGGELMKLGAHLLGEDKGPVKAGMNAFDGVMLQCNLEKELPAYKLAKTAEEIFRNLNVDKIELVEACLDELGNWPEIVGQAFTTPQHETDGGIRRGLSPYRRGRSGDLGYYRHGRGLAVLLQVLWRRGDQSGGFADGGDRPTLATQD